MNAGYVRLSKDDEKRNYVSIENQKLIIRQYAADHGVIIDRWYEDDGVSGYVFDRMGFQQMMTDLDKDIDAVYVKDFSRLGRHNAKVLLLLDEFQERGKHLIVIDDNYDSLSSCDDTIGIKTWFNERYVKDTSKKIKRAIEAKQKEGTLMTQPPFGYRRNKKNKYILEIVPKEAAYVKLIYELYTAGSGYRKIANYLTDQKIPTPSMIRHERELEKGKITKHKITTVWSDSMVKEILSNDFYIGTFRLRKRTRSTVHGKDKRVPKEEQFIFKEHHPAIIDKTTFDLIQNIKEKRVKNDYRGNRGQWISSDIPNPFGNCLFCKDCGKKLTPVKRKTQKYYICTTYNTKGKRYCSKAHLIKESDLMEDILTYLKMCRTTFYKTIATYDMKDLKTDQITIEKCRSDLKSSITEQKEQLKVLLKQKIRDLANTTENEGIINESYDSLQQDILSQIHSLEMQLAKQTTLTLKATENKDLPKNGLEIIDKIIADGSLDRRDIEILIDQIVVDEDGFPEIRLKYDLPKQINDKFTLLCD